MDLAEMLAQAAARLAPEFKSAEDRARECDRAYGEVNKMLDDWRRTVRIVNPDGTVTYSIINDAIELARCARCGTYGKHDCAPKLLEACK